MAPLWGLMKTTVIVRGGAIPGSVVPRSRVKVLVF